MSDPSDDDDAIIQMLLERLVSQRLPRVVAIRDRVNQGERLTDFDIDFLQEAMTDAGDAAKYLDRHPELQSLGVRLVQLYDEIVTKATENESKA